MNFIDFILGRVDPHQSPETIGGLAKRYKWMRGRGKRWTIWGNRPADIELRKVERLARKNARRAENGLAPLGHYKDC